MEYNLTEGNITGNLLKFAFPLMIGNLLQQCYNIADTLIVGRFLGADALAAVGSAYTLMVFLTSIILGLCMGSSAFFSMQFGAGFRKCLFHICGAEFRGRKKDRIHRGTRSAVTVSTVFCLVVSALVFIFAAPLMKIFIEASRPDIIKIGVGYLRIEGSFYFGIGILFLLYGYYRAVSKPAMSVVLTVISLGTRVVLAYVLSAISAVGVTGIWMSVPIGWILADATGILYMYKLEKNKR